MAEYIDIVGIKQAVNKGKMQAFVRDGSIYLKCKVSGECVKIGDAPAVDVASVAYGRDDLYVYDKDTGHTHRVGDDQHDSLYVSDGVVYYYNLQNGCGTLPDGSGTYEFVDSDCGWIDGVEEDA